MALKLATVFMQIDVETAEAFSQGRTAIDFTGYFDRSPLRPQDPRLSTVKNTFIDPR